MLERWAPPVRQRQFWVVQALVLVIAGGHSLIETAHYLEDLEVAFIPVSLFLLPVIYAGLAFGLRGSGPTAVWCALITLPNALLWHGDPIGTLGELWQAGLVVAVGIFVGVRIDGERRARADVEQRERERRASEEKYRTVFESAGDPIILLDETGLILEANAAAALLFGRPAEDLRDRSLASAVPAELAAALADTNQEGVVGPVAGPDGTHLWLMPVRTIHADASGRSRILLLLRDVTLQMERQQLLEGYAGHTVAAREEERRRVARDLHDGPLQSVVLLWRRLDQVDPSDPDLRATLDDARTTVEAVAAELRRFGRDLRPSVLDDLGLDAALRAEVTALEARAGVAGKFDARGDSEDLTPAEQLTLFRVCQEALHNVERHAQASRVSVRLSVSAKRTELVIEDDGVGVATPPVPRELLRQGKLGLIGMQERARLIGGVCTVRPGRRGTVVRLVAPRSTNA